MPEISNIKKCPNCGFEPFDSPFCPSCGQRKLSPKDLSVVSMAGEFLQGFLNLENALTTTLRNFFGAPAKYVREYQKGARKKYLSPIKLFLLANAFYFLFPSVNTFMTSLQIQMNRMIYSDLVKGWIEGRMAASSLTTAQFHAQYDELTAMLSKALLLFLPLVFAASTWLLSLSQRKKTPFIFHVNRSLVLHAFILLVVVSIIPGLYFFTAQLFGSAWMLKMLTEFNLTVFSVLIINLYGMFLYRRFFKSVWWANMLRMVMLNVIFFYLIYLYRFFLLLATLAWMAAFR